MKKVVQKRTRTKETLEMHIGFFLQQKRKAAKLSQRDVADALKYTTPQFISNWERGLSFPPKKALKVLMRKYNLSTEDLEGLKGMYLKKVMRDAESHFVF